MILIVPILMKLLMFISTSTIVASTTILDDYGCHSKHNTQIARTMKSSVHISNTAPRPSFFNAIVPAKTPNSKIVEKGKSRKTKRRQKT